jgi:hypothetical protein
MQPRKGYRTHLHNSSSDSRHFFSRGCSVVLPASPVVVALLPLVPLHPVLALSPAVRPRVVRLARLLLLLLVDLDQPVVLAVLVLALVAPLGHPFASRFVVHQLAVALLVLDALLRGEELPLGLLFRSGQLLLAGKGRGWAGQDEVDAFRVGLDLACGEKLVYEGLRCVAGGCAERLFIRGFDGVGVVGEEVAEIECEGCGLVHGNGPVACQCMPVQRALCIIQSARDGRVGHGSGAVQRGRLDVHGATVDSLGELRVRGGCCVQRDTAVHFSVRHFGWSWCFV